MTDNIKICLIKKDKQYDITNILEKVQWSGDYKSVARKLDFSILTRVTNIGVSVGDFILFYVNNKKIFKGIVWETSVGSSGDSMSILAYDNGIYLLKNNLVILNPVLIILPIVIPKSLHTLDAISSALVFLKLYAKLFFNK